MELRNDHSTADWVDAQLKALASLSAATPVGPHRGLARLRMRQRQIRGRQRKSALTAAALFAAAGVALTYPRTRAYAQECMEACVSESSRVGRFVVEKLTPGSSRQLQQASGRQTAPDFKLTDSEGRPIQLSALRGRVVLLNFWATWCAPCRAEIPCLVDLQQRYRDRGLTVVGVSLDDEGWSAVRPFLTQNQVNYPVGIGDASLTTAYGGVESLPATLIIDRQGRIISVHAGLVSKETYERAISAALSETGEN